jgi:hypothetical protein
MRHAIVENGVVTNVVLADEVTGRANGWIPSEDAGDSWTYDGEKFSPPAPDAAKEAAFVREKRNALLMESDVAVMADRWELMDSADRQSWANYRQALRDVTIQDGFPFVVVWPSRPQ